MSADNARSNHTSTNTRAGRFIEVGTATEPFLAFYPKPLPVDPPLDIDAELQDLLDRANQELGRLDGITLLLPDPDLFLYSYIRKEAVLSSQIEGTQSSLSDLLLFEHDAAPGVPIEDVKETSNYIAAMDHGLKRLAAGFPMSLRLIKEIHGLLLQDVRGSERAPGEFRTTQNWIGGSRPGTARFVPPPASEVLPAMGALEKFIHDDPVRTQVLIKVAVTHAQFESIHPFLDGNGRIGRLLITLLLCSHKPPVLSRPLLYLSLYLKQFRDSYYEHLQRIRTHGEWEQWVGFFLEGVIDVATSAIDTTQRIVKTLERDRQRIHMELGRGSATASRVHDLVAHDVVTTAPHASRSLKVTEPPIYAAIARLEKLGILREVTGRQRGKTYVYDEYLSLLNEGTEDS